MTGAHLLRLEVRLRVRVRVRVRVEVRVRVRARARVRVTNPNQAVVVSKGRVRNDSGAAKCSVADTRIAPTLLRSVPWLTPLSHRL